MDSSRFLTFYHGLNTIVKIIKKKEAKYMKEYGLRSVHMGCLLYIRQSKDGMTITQLAKSCRSDKALISRTIRELLDDGFVLKRAWGEDKTYNQKYYLTEKSESITNDINKDIENYVIAARGDISSEDLATFYRVLASFEENITRILEED